MWFKSHHSLHLNHSSAHISPSAMVAHFVIYELVETKFAENIVKLRGFSKAAEMSPLLLVFCINIEPYWLEKSGFIFFFKNAYIRKKSNFCSPIRPSKDLQLKWEKVQMVFLLLWLIELAKNVTVFQNAVQKHSHRPIILIQTQERANQVLFVFHRIL